MLGTPFTSPRWTPTLRLLALLLFIALLVIAAASRIAGTALGDKINVGEVAALARCRELHAAYLKHVEETGSTVHPGLGVLAREFAGLSALQNESDFPQRSYAVGEFYMYGVHTVQQRQLDDTFRDDYILRAWPLSFGHTGDVEYVLQDGRLWIGANRIGRSGAEYGYPPPFPEQDIGEPKTPWRRVDLIAN